MTAPTPSLFTSAPTDPVSALLARLDGVRSRGRGWKALCPCHPDRNPSLDIDVGETGKLLAICRSCGATLPAVLLALGMDLDSRGAGPGAARRADVHADAARRRLALQLGMDVHDPRLGGATVPRVPVTTTRRDVPLDPIVARAIMRAAAARAQTRLQSDADAWAYLDRRQLAGAVERGALGLLAGGMRIDDGNRASDHLPIPEWVRPLPRRGYRLCCPLYSAEDGTPVGLGTRSIRPDVDPKKKCRHSRKIGVLHADSRGAQLLAGRWTGPRVALLVEGMTDTLVTCALAPVPVLGLPGVGGEREAMGAWARGTTVLIAVDTDAKGEDCAAALVDAVYAAGGTPQRLHWPRVDGVKDACDAVAKLGPAVIRRAIERAAGGAT